MSATVGEVVGVLQAFASVLRALRDRPRCLDCGAFYRQESNWSRCRPCRSARLASKYERAAPVPGELPSLDAQKAARTAVARHARSRLYS